MVAPASVRGSVLFRSLGYRDGEQERLAPVHWVEGFGNRSLFGCAKNLL
jgi:hypothetical protein